MSELTKRLHTKAFLGNFELACIFGIWICTTDLVWLTHDILSNGLSVWYVVVGFGLIVGNLGTLFVLVRHHQQYFRKLIHKRIERLVIKHRG